MDIFARDVTFATLAQSLSAQSHRQTLIAGNIANVNTPGYKRRDIADFSAEIGRRAGQAAARAPKGRGAWNRSWRARWSRTSCFTGLTWAAWTSTVKWRSWPKSSLFGSAYNQLLQKRICQYRMVIRDGRCSA